MHMRSAPQPRPPGTPPSTPPPKAGRARTSHTCATVAAWRAPRCVHRGEHHAAAAGGEAGPGGLRGLPCMAVLQAGPAHARATHTDMRKSPQKQFSNNNVPPRPSLHRPRVCRGSTSLFGILRHPIYPSLDMRQTCITTQPIMQCHHHHHHHHHLHHHYSTQNALMPLPLPPPPLLLFAAGLPCCTWYTLLGSSSGGSIMIMHMIIIIIISRRHPLCVGPCKSAQRCVQWQSTAGATQRGHTPTVRHITLTRMLGAAHMSRRVHACLPIAASCRARVRTCGSTAAGTAPPAATPRPWPPAAAPSRQPWRPETCAQALAQAAERLAWGAAR